MRLDVRKIENECETLFNTDAEVKQCVKERVDSLNKKTSKNTSSDKTKRNVIIAVSAVAIVGIGIAIYLASRNKK